MEREHQRGIAQIVKYKVTQVVVDRIRMYVYIDHSFAVSRLLSTLQFEVGDGSARLMWGSSDATPCSRHHTRDQISADKMR